MSFFLEFVYEAFELVHAGFHVIMIDRLDSGEEVRLEFASKSEHCSYLVSDICFTVLVLADRSGRLSVRRLLDAGVA